LLLCFKRLKKKLLAAALFIGLSQVVFAAPRLKTYEGDIFSSLPSQDGKVQKMEEKYKANSSDPLLKSMTGVAMNEEGMTGLIVGNTAHKLPAGRLVTGFRYNYSELNSTKGAAFRTVESGEIHSFEFSGLWVTENGEISVNIPVRDWYLDAPLTMGIDDSLTGLGNMTLGVKRRLREHEYYRFAVGGVLKLATGDSGRMGVAGSDENKTFKLFTCVTTKETDKATANLEIGTIFRHKSEEKSSFIYRFGIAYAVTEHVALIGELAGEVVGSDDKDTMDMVMAARFAVTEKVTLELAYFNNLRTYRSYGWDSKIQGGVTAKW